MRVLQIGSEDWSSSTKLPAEVEWVFVDVSDEFSFDPDFIGRVDVTIVDAPCANRNLLAVDSLITPHTLLVAPQLDEEPDDGYRQFFARKAARYDEMSDRQVLIDQLPAQYFERQFGQRLELHRTLVSPFYQGEVRYEGNNYLTLNINTGGGSHRGGGNSGLREDRSGGVNSGEVPGGDISGEGSQDAKSTGGDGTPPKGSTTTKNGSNTVANNAVGDGLVAETTETPTGGSNEGTRTNATQRGGNSGGAGGGKARGKGKSARRGRGRDTRPSGKDAVVRDTQSSATTDEEINTQTDDEDVIGLDEKTDDRGDFRQLMMWKENILYENRRPLEIWPEFVRDEGCELELVVQLIQSGSSDVIAYQRRYSEAELAEPIVFSHPSSGYLSCSIFARGAGQVKIGPLHYRHSRQGAGHFLPGGKRLVDNKREELFYYYHPGNLRPPLNIYFAGYRPAEGFEGYFMMTGLEHPFLLITDPRLEGGRFYLGSEELESGLRQVIREHIDILKFREEDVIFSGLSMGSFGALYYGSQFRPHAIIAGKPIIDLGLVAERGRLVRPKDFLTIFDIVNFWNRTGDSSKAVAQPPADTEADTATVASFTRNLIDRWNGDPGFGDTKILMSYMEQDDYDNEAYYTLLGSQTGKATTVIARGYQGRHNDDSASIVTWFVNQYKRVIDEYAAGTVGSGALSSTTSVLNAPSAEAVSADTVGAATQGGEGAE